MVIVLGSRIPFNSIEVLYQIRISVRKAMRKVLYVIIVFEYVRESERVVISGKAKVITLVLVLIVRNTIAYPVPAHSLLLLDFSRK